MAQEVTAGPVISAAAQVFACRAFRAGDLPFVRDSWLRSAWDVQNRALKADGVKSRARALAGAAWHGINRPKVTALLLSPSGVTVSMACDRSDDDHLAGWLAVKGPSVIYAYTKAAYRGWGLIQMLADAAGVEWRRP